jgi:hypothetical protein
MITLEELATKVDALERKVAKLSADGEGQDVFNTRLMGMVKEVRDDVALLRTHSVSAGQKLEQLDTNFSAFQRGLPSMIAETMREVNSERDIKLVELMRKMMDERDSKR